MGFTLVELMMVVVIMGIIAVSVIPAMGNVRDMRAGAARDDVARMLEITKGNALASGEPVGLRIDVERSELTMIHLSVAGTITPMTDPLTGQDRMVNITQTYSDVSLSGIINGDGSSGSGMIWFDYESTPHTRNPSGDFTAINDEPAVITLSSGSTVIVHAHSGLVEKP